MHRVEPLKKRWTPARYAARMAKRERRAAGIRPGARAQIYIPIVPRVFKPAPDVGLLLLGLSALFRLRRRFRLA